MKHKLLITMIALIIGFMTSCTFTAKLSFEKKSKSNQVKQFATAPAKPVKKIVKKQPVKPVKKTVKKPIKK